MGNSGSTVQVIIDKQVTFDTVVAHLRKQKCKAISGTMCKYRDALGNKCAVGCLIPDEDYYAGLEDMGVFMILNKLRLGHDLNLCRDLQGVHDSYHVEHWEHELRIVADRHQLTYKEQND